MLTPEAKQRIDEIVEGVLRKINNPCDLSLLIELSKKQQLIGPQIIEEIMDDGTLF